MENIPALSPSNLGTPHSRSPLVTAFKRFTNHVTCSEILSTTTPVSHPYPWQISKQKANPTVVWERSGQTRIGSKGNKSTSVLVLGSWQFLKSTEALGFGFTSNLFTTRIQPQLTTVKLFPKWNILNCLSGYCLRWYINNQDQLSHGQCIEIEHEKTCSTRI